jgi:hypothetical protein
MAIKLHLTTPFDAISERTKFLFGKVRDLVDRPWGLLSAHHCERDVRVVALIAVGASCDENSIANKYQGSIA